MNQENLEKFYDHFGSKRFLLQSEMARERSKRLLELYYRSTDFIYKTITTIGIVAGFGFTALSHVRNVFLFTTGEGVLLSTIALGIWATQKIYLNEIKNLEGLYTRIRTNFSEYTVLFEMTLAKAQSSVLPLSDIRALQQKDRELLAILQDSPEGKKDRRELDSFLPHIIWAIFVLFVVGGLLLLLSFIRNSPAQVP